VLLRRDAGQERGNRRCRGRGKYRSQPRAGQFFERAPAALSRQKIAAQAVDYHQHHLPVFADFLRGQAGERGITRRRTAQPLD
jgi:hypothetical protein